eukprot:Hpha_TRINITY_DN15686_c1_g2::TRINITY_DN15686_c1_g2_i1::g.100382::m.100382
MMMMSGPLSGPLVAVKVKGGEGICNELIDEVGQFAGTLSEELAVVSKRARVMWVKGLQNRIREQALEAGKKGARNLRFEEDIPEFTKVDIDNGREDVRNPSELKERITQGVAALGFKDFNISFCSNHSRAESFMFNLKWD